jgi:hypothetical protein
MGGGASPGQTGMGQYLNPEPSDEFTPSAAGWNRPLYPSGIGEPVRDNDPATTLRPGQSNYFISSGDQPMIGRASRPAAMGPMGTNFTNNLLSYDPGTQAQMQSRVTTAISGVGYPQGMPTQKPDWMKTPAERADDAVGAALAARSYSREPPTVDSLNRPIVRPTTLGPRNGSGDPTLFAQHQARYSAIPQIATPAQIADRQAAVRQNAEYRAAGRIGLSPGQWDSLKMARAPMVGGEMNVRQMEAAGYTPEMIVEHQRIQGAQQLAKSAHDFEMQKAGQQNQWSSAERKDTQTFQAGQSDKALSVKREELANDLTIARNSRESAEKIAQGARDSGSANAQLMAFTHLLSTKESEYQAESRYYPLVLKDYRANRELLDSWKATKVKEKDPAKRAANEAEYQRKLADLGPAPQPPMRPDYEQLRGTFGALTSSIGKPNATGTGVPQVRPAGAVTPPTAQPPVPPTGTPVGVPITSSRSTSNTAPPSVQDKLYADGDTPSAPWNGWDYLKAGAGIGVGLPLLGAGIEVMKRGGKAVSPVAKFGYNAGAHPINTVRSLLPKAPQVGASALNLRPEASAGIAENMVGNMPPRPFQPVIQPTVEGTGPEWVPPIEPVPTTGAPAVRAPRVGKPKGGFITNPTAKELAAAKRVLGSAAKNAGKYAKGVGDKAPLLAAVEGGVEGGNLSDPETWLAMHNNGQNIPRVGVNVMRGAGRGLIDMVPNTVNAVSDFGNYINEKVGLSGRAGHVGMWSPYLTMPYNQESDQNPLQTNGFGAKPLTREEAIALLQQQDERARMAEMMRRARSVR